MAALSLLMIVQIVQCDTSHVPVFHCPKEGERCTVEASLRTNSGGLAILFQKNAKLSILSDGDTRSIAGCLLWLEWRDMSTGSTRLIWQQFNTDIRPAPHLNPHNFLVAARDDNRVGIAYVGPVFSFIEVNVQKHIPPLELTHKPANLEEPGRAFLGVEVDKLPTIPIAKLLRERHGDMQMRRLLAGEKKIASLSYDDKGWVFIITAGEHEFKLIRSDDMVWTLED
jgi:hypothetical protein